MNRVLHSFSPCAAIPNYSSSKNTIDSLDPFSVSAVNGTLEEANMRILDKSGLIRGEAIVSSVFSKNETPWHFETADIVGSVAAYIGYGYETHEIFKVMRPRVGVGLARDMEKVFYMFNDMNGRGL